MDRQELIGKFGESTAFDVRYFELAPGGYSSREKHFHTHVVIPVRGQVNSSARTDLSFASPGYCLRSATAVHQLSNPTSEPFGFLCIVDHDR